MTDDVITRMRNLYTEYLGEGWKVTPAERRDWTFSLRCEMNNFVAFSSWLREYASFDDLNKLAYQDCTIILHTFENEQQKVI